MIRVAINGCGRIGRIAFREMITSRVFDVVAINDLSTPEEKTKLIKYDTIHRSFHKNEIGFDEYNIIIKKISSIMKKWNYTKKRCMIYYRFIRIMGNGMKKLI